jgi:hypothetical protein
MEVGTFLSLFNRDGYVLNFSTNDFNVFTLNSVGVALCEHYKMSKGKSLLAYINDANEGDIVKLLIDLLEHYELHYQEEIHATGEGAAYSLNGTPIVVYQRYYQKCRAVIDRIKGLTSSVSVAGETLKEKFSSEYISAQIDLMMKMQFENPTEAIGKAKEVLESCCKTILEENAQTVSKDWSVSQLVKATMVFLEVSTENVDKTTTEATTVKAILGNLHGIAGNISLLRNAYGSGHGKGSSFRGLTVRHSKLAIGSSVTLVQYLWETYEWRKASKKL